jgi:hypothetical protein
MMDLVKGAVAGALATYAMGRTTTWLYERESKTVRQREDGARGGESAYVSAAAMLARSAGVELGDEARQRAGTAIHWATGIIAGMKYAAIRRSWPAVSAGFGLAYGTAFFVVMDEIMNPVLGLTPGPAAFPLETHARGFAGHLVFGATTEAALRALDG